MSGAAAPETYLGDRPFPYCKGCGHGLVARALNRALVNLGLPPETIVLTSDIGCVGLVDPLFPRLHTVHTIHGRSTAVAAGAVLADAVLGDGRMKNVVMMGDGGATIGLLHLAQAALMNVDLTVVLHNNMLYGMTGGQHSALTPAGFHTSTTPTGNWVPALEMEGFLRSCETGFFARQLATDAELPQVLADAIAHPGFALVEVLELCTGYGVPLNQLDGKALRAMTERQGRPLGRRIAERKRPPFHEAYRERFPHRERDGGPAVEVERETFHHGLTRPAGIVLSGSAGERVQSSAAVLCHAALRSGLFCTQKNDYPVTVGTGFSLSEVALSGERIVYTGIDRPDAVLITSAEGLREVRGRGDLDRLAPGATVIVDESIAGDVGGPHVTALPLRRELTPDHAALGALAVLVARRAMLDRRALHAAIDALGGRDTDASHRAVDTAWS